MKVPTVCKDHENADWNQPALDDEACVLCRLFYLEAQETLLEEWQQRAKLAEDAIAEIKRPLDEQMARLNATVTRLNEENERLRSTPSATEPTTTAKTMAAELKTAQRRYDELAVLHGLTPIYGTTDGEAK